MLYIVAAFPEAITVTMALSLIVFISICLGAVLPLLLEKLKIDPAHSSTTIQVIMDILGVFLAVVVSSAVLDGPFGAYLLPKLGYAWAWRRRKGKKRKLLVRNEDAQNKMKRQKDNTHDVL